MHRIEALIAITGGYGTTAGAVVNGVASVGEVVTVEVRCEGGEQVLVTGTVLEILSISNF